LVLGVIGREVGYARAASELVERDHDMKILVMSTPRVTTQGADT
jgi:hypothetical protein